MIWETVHIDGRAVRVAVARTERGVWVGWPGDAMFVSREGRKQAASAATSDSVDAPMTGKVVQVRVKAGDTVAEGDVLVVLEAMKMEYRLGSPRAGTVGAVRCEPGQLVDLGATLVELA